jgi:hypothetical protein
VHLVCFAVAALASVYLTGLRLDLNVIHDPGSIANVMAGDAATPFQYRILVPGIVSAIYRTSLVTQDQLSPQELALILEALCVVGIYAGVRALLTRIGISSVVSSASALIVFYLLPFCYLLPREQAYWYFWDVPAVLAFTLGVWFLHDRRWVAYYVLFAVGTLNRETTVFLTAVHLLTGWPGSDRRALALHIVAQAALWIGIRYGLYRIFRDNIGYGLVPNVLERNFLTLMTPAGLLVLASSLGLLWMPVLFLRGRIANPFVRRAVLVIVPYFVGGFYVGDITELRIWGELTPIVAIGFVALVHSLATDSRTRAAAA